MRADALASIRAQAAEALCEELRPQSRLVLRANLARNVPALLAHIEELDARIQAARAALERALAHTGVDDAATLLEVRAALDALAEPADPGLVPDPRLP